MSDFKDEVMVVVQILTWHDKFLWQVFLSAPVTLRFKAKERARNVPAVEFGTSE